MENYIGSHLMKKNEVVPVQSLKDYKIVLLYIGAQWSPPCLNFNPELENFYSEANRKRKAKVLEIVYISCDYSQKDFEDSVTSLN